MTLPATEPFGGSAVDLPAVLTCASLRRYRWKAPPAAVEALARQRIDQMLGATGACALSVTDGPRVHGLAVLLPLEWDSRVLGMPAARLEVLTSGPYAQRIEVVDALVRAVCSQAAARGIKHVSARVDAADDAAVHVLERRGFINVDAILTFGADLDQIVIGSAASGVSVRPAVPTDAVTVGDIAGASFTDGRFHADPAIDRASAERVYREWAVACVTGAAADYVAIASAGDRLAGFVACRLMGDTAVHFGRPTSTITLIATAPDVRGQGVGPVLIGAARTWCRAQNADTLEVGTPIRNLRAARLYERSGFRLVSSSLSFRKLIDP
jgi:ribosomal protein S18 acetylase RimI-like enzyme